MKKYSRLEHTAYHEAGHAVMSYVQKVGFLYVTIEPEKEEKTLGHLRHPKSTYKAIEFASYSDYGVNRIKKLIKVSLAGHAAEEVFTGKKNKKFSGSYSDFKKAVDLASFLNGDPEVDSAYLELSYLETRNCLRGHLWNPSLHALANALLEKKTIKRNEAKEIIYKASPLSSLPPIPLAIQEMCKKK